jgi:hypothetical protein
VGGGLDDPISGKGYFFLLSAWGSFFFNRPLIRGYSRDDRGRVVIYWTKIRVNINSITDNMNILDTDSGQYQLYNGQYEYNGQGFSEGFFISKFFDFAPPPTTKLMPSIL